MFKFIRIFLLVLIGLFVQFDFLGAAGAVIIKLVLLIGISWELYELWQEQELRKKDTLDESDVISSAPIEEEEKETSISIFDIAIYRLKTLIELEGKYLDFLREQFALIWNLILPHNGYLIYRSENGRLRLLHQKIRAGVDWHFKNDSLPVLDFVDQHNGMLVENTLLDADRIIPFYRDKSYRPQAFLAFSTPFHTEEKLYWIFDADSNDFFNNEDVPVILSINGNIQNMLELALKEKKLEDFYLYEQDKVEIAKALNVSQTLDQAVEAFAQFLTKQFEASKLTIAFRTEGNKAVIHKSIGLDDPFKQGYEFVLDEGLNGWVIMKNKPYLIDNIDKGDYFIPRFSRSEKTNYGIKCFLSVPIEQENAAIGLVTLEHKQDNKYKELDKERLKTFTEIFAQTVNRIKQEEKIGG